MTIRFAIMDKADKSDPLNQRAVFVGKLSGRAESWFSVGEYEHDCEPELAMKAIEKVIAAIRERVLVESENEAQQAKTMEALA